jgi:hypothetical protein
MEPVILHCRKVSDETRAEILRVLSRDPLHNARRVAREFHMRTARFAGFAKAAGITLMVPGYNNPVVREATSESLRRLWANQAYAQIMSEIVSEAAFQRRQPRIAAKCQQKLNHD